MVNLLQKFFTNSCKILKYSNKIHKIQIQNSVYNLSLLYMQTTVQKPKTI